MPESLEKAYTNCYNKGAVYKEVPYNYIKFAEELIDMVEVDEESARKKYKRIFKYVDLVNGVVVSVGNHQAGCVVSPYPVEEWFGTFTTKTNDYPISVLNMKEIDSLNFVKLDILGLDNVGLIYKTCDLAGIPYATPDNIPPDDENVWKSIREDTTMIFQWEYASATAYLQKLFSDSTIKKIRAKNPDASYMDLLSIGNGAIRPAGESYRDKLSNGEYALYGNEALDDFLKPTLGWLVYQEQIIGFLHKFCGFTMGEADIVRRHFSKKTGTDKDIPIIKNGGYLNDNHYIKGFIQTMYDDYGVEQEEAEKLIVGFLQVIIDASDYLFSKNHADPYSWIGYICGYLRYYYPLEFITSALNIFIGKEDKTLAITEYAKKRGIKISSIKFRHSTAEYTFDKETNTIFKGVESIKFMNSKVAKVAILNSDKSYISFIDCISDFLTGTAINMKQMRILIDLDFFEEFGDANYLNMQLDLFDKYSGRSQISKKELSTLHVSEEEARSFSAKETAKMFSGIDSLAMLRIAATKLKYRRRTLREKIGAQIEHLGYVDIVGDQYSGIACVTSIDTKYSPRLTLYSLKNGTSYQCKIDKRTFSQTKLAKGDILKVMSNRFKPKVKKDENGDWVEIPDTRELWITKYQRLDNL
jgi:DNA polymerase-3 subunit alpha